MRSRSRSIRSKLVLLLLVPLLSLTALWGFSAGITLGPGLSLLHVGTLVDFAKTTDAFSGALQDERRAAAVQAAKPGAKALRTFTDKRRATDRARAAFFAQADGSGVRSAIKDKAAGDIDTFRAAVNALDGIRRQVEGGHSTVSTVMDAYTAALNDAYQVTESTIITFGDADFARRSRNVVDFARARDTLAQEDAVMAAMLARGGRMTAPQHARFAESLGVQRYEYGQVVPTLSDALRKRYARVVASPQYKRMRAMENRIAFHTKHGGHMHVLPQQWKAATSQVLRQQQAMLRAGADELTAAGRPLAFRILGQLAATALFGLVAVLLSLIISVRMSRSLIRELSELRHSAREVAERRLPAVVRRLRRGERIDVAAEVESSTYRTREIAQVGAALGSVQRTAMEEAVGEARLRTGIRDVFVNLARRSQALLHRQLKLLDGMERRTDDPDELDRLFQLDHLATRMRRHAEGLIILSGSTPGRTWRRPVPLVDVMRAAVAEVEDYPRVTVEPMPDAALAGPAVADVVHLVAELVENATLYSPPHTEVRISAEPVGSGYAVEIDDRGLSMSGDDLAEANQRLSDPPEFDLSDSARLGLFVVGRLARRHGIRVSLRVSAYGGTTAIMLLPGDLVITDEAALVDPGPYAERLHPAEVTTGEATDPPPPGHVVPPPALPGPSTPEDPGAPGGDRTETAQSAFGDPPSPANSTQGAGPDPSPRLAPPPPLGDPASSEVSAHWSAGDASGGLAPPPPLGDPASSEGSGAAGAGAAGEETAGPAGVRPRGAASGPAPFDDGTPADGLAANGGVASLNGHASAGHGVTGAPGSTGDDAGDGPGPAAYGAGDARVPGDRGGGDAAASGGSTADAPAPGVRGAGDAPGRGTGRLYAAPDPDEGADDRTGPIRAVPPSGDLPRRRGRTRAPGRGPTRAVGDPDARSAERPSAPMPEGRGGVPDAGTAGASAGAAGAGTRDGYDGAETLGAAGGSGTTGDETWDASGAGPQGTAGAGAAGKETRDAAMPRRGAPGAMGEEAGAGAPGAGAGDPGAGVPYGAGRQDAYPTTANGLPRRVRTRRRDVAGARPFAPAGGAENPEDAPRSRGTAWDKPAAPAPARPARDRQETESAPAGNASAEGAPATDGPGTAWDKARDDGAAGGSVGGGPAAGGRPSAWDERAGSAGGAYGGSSGEGERPALPKRVRQANLAPQLRTDARAADLEVDLTGADTSAGRTPEEARAMMSSIQQGWLRGRAQPGGDDTPTAGAEPTADRPAADERHTGAEAGGGPSEREPGGGDGGA